MPAHEGYLRGRLVVSFDVEFPARLSEAQAAGAAKAEFLATMSHEIRTPMNSILGFTQTLIRRDDLPEEARRQLHLIDRAGASLLALVNDILDFSKLEAGEVELALRPVRRTRAWMSGSRSQDRPAPSPRSTSSGCARSC